MKRWKNKEWQTKAICVTVAIGLLMVLVPLFAISLYSCMSADDYSFAMQPATTWKETGSVIRVMLGQFAVVKKSYMTWQGTYFAEWLNTTLIGICGENAYYLGTFLSLGGLVISEMSVLILILTKGLGADRFSSGIVSMCCIIMQILLVPVPVEAFYWFCSAITYTFVYALCWFLVGLLFLFCRRENGRKWERVLSELLIIFTSIAIGGSNYITGLVMAIVYAFFTVWSFYVRHKGKCVMLSNMLIYMFAFVINVIAPGNMVRQRAAQVERLSVLESIWMSFETAVEYVACNIWVPNVIMGVILIPFFLNIVKKRNYKFPLPMLVSILSFCVFAAHFTPTLYSIQYIGAGRVLNIYRFNFYILLYANELYWIGWLWHRYSAKTVDGSSADSEEILQASWLLPGFAFGSVLLCISLRFWGGNTISTVSAVTDLRNGAAKQYYVSHLERVKIYKDVSIKEAYVERYSATPYLLFFTDIKENEDDWVNRSIAAYYDKDVVGYVKIE